MDQVSISLPQFRQLLNAAGYDEVLERSWAPDTVLDTHSHPFDVSVLMVAGELTLAIGAEAPRVLRAGDTFHLGAGVPHAERYGPQGARFWVARRNVPAP